MQLNKHCGCFHDQKDHPLGPDDNANCECCMMFEECINNRLNGKEPLTLEQLRDMTWKYVWVETPGIRRYGRSAIVEDVNVEQKILWLKDDFTCHQYGEVWVAYDLEAVT